MLAGSLSDLQRMMDRLTMVSVNYNMKINTKKTNVLRVRKGSESAIKIVFAGEIIEQVKEFCYLGNMISDDATYGEIKRRIATMASIWFEIWGVVDPGQKISISTGKFPKNFNFSRNFIKEYRVFQANFRKFLFFQAIKKVDFPTKKCPLTATSGQVILFLFKSNHFRTYFL